MSGEFEKTAMYDPLSDFNILSSIKWNQETLKFLEHQWASRSPRGLTLPEFISVMLKVFSMPQTQKMDYIHKLISFYKQIDIESKQNLEWEDFLKFITACCVFDRESTSVDTVVNYHFQKEIHDRSGNFTVLKFIYDSINDQILSFNANGAVHIYSPSTLSLVRRIRLYNKQINAIFDGAIIPEKSLLAVVYATGIQILSTAQGCSLVQDIETPQVSHFCIMYEETNNSLFTGTEDGKLCCWKAEFWNEKPTRMNFRMVSQTQVTSGKALTCIVPIPNSAVFATGDEDGQLIIWDRKNIRIIHKIPAHHAPIHSICYSDSLHGLITAAFEGTVLAWNPFIPFQLSRIDCPTGVVTAMTCLPDSPHLIMTDRGGYLYIVNSRTMTMVQQFSISPFGQFANLVSLTESVHAQLTRSLLVTGSFPVTALSHCGQRKRFVLGGRMIQFYEYEENINPTLSDRVPIRVALMNTQFKSIVTCSGVNVRHWELSSGLMRCVFRKIAPSLITAMCFDDCQTLMFLGCHKGELNAYHYPTGNLLYQIGKSSGSITSIYFSAVFRVLITSSWGGSITIWTPDPNGKKTELKTEKKNDILCMAVSDNLQTIAAGNDKGDIFIWSTSEMKLSCVVHPQKTECEILALYFCDDSELLISSDSHGCITFFAKQSDTIVPVTQLPNYYSGSQTSNITCFAVKNKYLISGDSYGELRLWDISGILSQYTSTARPILDKSGFSNLLSQKGALCQAHTSDVPLFDCKSFVLPVGSFKLILKWKAHHGSITSLSSFSVNKYDIILTSSSDCCSAIWNMRTGECLGFLQSNPKFGLNERKWSLDFKPDINSNVSEAEFNEILAAVAALDSA